MAVLLRLHHERLEERVECERDAGYVIQGDALRVRPSNRGALPERRLLGRPEAQLGHV